MTLSEMVERAHAASRDKGWYDPPHDKRNLGEMLALLHSEVTEMLECYRDGEMAEYTDEKGKPLGFPSEAADVAIRLGDLCGYLGLDLEGAVERKMAFNKTRPHRHGGKVA